MTKIYDWSKAPYWAKYAARDSNGFARWFEGLPYPDMENVYQLEWLIDRVYSTDNSCDPYTVDDVPPALLSLESRDDSIDSKDPLAIYLGKEISVIRTNLGNVRVSIFRNKEDNTYSFINLTKNRICPCKFKSVEDALLDLVSYRDKDVDFYSIET